MTDSLAAVAELVVGGHIVEAVEAAEEHSVDAVLAQLTYDVMDRHAAQFDGFFNRWYREAGSLGRKIDIEYAVRAHRATALCHLDGVADRAIEMYLDAQQLLLDRLRMNIHQVSMLASVPEATMPASRAAQILGYQAILSRLRFDISPQCDDCG